MLVMLAALVFAGFFGIIMLIHIYICLTEILEELRNASKQR